MAYAVPPSLDLGEELMCSICLELFREPVCLPCEHYYCRQCICDAWAKQALFSCPQCRQTFPERTFTASRLLKNLVLRAQGLVRQGSLGESGAPVRCPQHEEPLKLFCKDEGVPICLICRDAPKHSGHSFLPIQDAVQVCADQLQKDLGKLRHKIEEFQECRRDQEEELDSVKEAASFFHQHISSEFAKLRRFLEEREKTLIRELEEEQEAARADMEANLSRLTEELRVAQESVMELEGRLQLQKDPVAFLQGMRIPSERSHQEEGVAKEKQRGECKPTVVCRDLSLGRFQGPIQYSAWKEMKSIVHPGYTSLIVDPSTTHPKLIVSEDLTSVKYNLGNPHPPVNPKRFDTYLGALASLGFTSGRHYWEVVVKEKPDWDVGVAVASVRRKGRVTASLQYGYWALWLRKGVELTAQDSPPRALLPRGLLQRIGIYLDYGGGQVSFYDADDMSHLYTFTSTFTEKLYPFFCTCFSAYGMYEPVQYFHPKI